MKRKKLFIALSLSLALSACSVQTRPSIEKHVFSIVIQEVPTLKNHGTQEWTVGRCVIKLREYPVCLQHEVRHCIEGNWHKGIETTDDCFK